MLPTLHTSANECTAAIAFGKPSRRLEQVLSAAARNLEQMRLFYLAWPPKKISQTASAKLAPPRQWQRWVKLGLLFAGRQHRGVTGEVELLRRPGCAGHPFTMKPSITSSFLFLRMPECKVICLVFESKVAESLASVQRQSAFAWRSLSVKFLPSLLLSMTAIAWPTLPSFTTTTAWSRGVDDTLNLLDLSARTAAGISIAYCTRGKSNPEYERAAGTHCGAHW